MAVTLINDYGVGDIDLTAMMETLDEQRLGYMQLSLTQMGTTTVPAVAAGSIFECNGGLYESATETALGGSPSDGKVFIYFDPATLAFTMTNTAPTWSDSKQGFYGTSGTANCRYLPFIMTKSTTTYSFKRWIINNNSANYLTLETGDDADKMILFASNALIWWIEASTYFLINQPIYLADYLNITGSASPALNLTGGPGTGEHTISISHDATLERLNIDHPVDVNGKITLENVGSHAAITNGVALFSKDISASAVLGISSETAVGGAPAASNATLKVEINGSTYYINLSTALA